MMGTRVQRIRKKYAAFVQKFRRILCSNSHPRAVRSSRLFDAFSGSAATGAQPDDKGGSSATVQPAHIGEASWYGPGFEGKKTASGEIFDDSKLTAAHKTIPLGSKAKVTNLTNGKTVEVKINDRGPFIDGRMVDLSRAAAKALGMIDRGTARVQIDLLPDINRERSENAPTMTIEESSRR